MGDKDLNKKKAVHQLGVFGFFAMTASMVMTVYEYPSFASSGFKLVFFLVVGGLLWFLPVSLCAAEMATVEGWEKGGIYSWVGNTLGQRWGFSALFFQWFQITVGFVTMCFFILAALAYVFKVDALYKNPLAMFIGVAVIVWVLTFAQLGGTKYTEKISKIGLIGGIAVPILILNIGLVAYFMTGGKSQIDLSVKSLVPDFSDVKTLVIFASFILAYMGVEASASHVHELKEPNKMYPEVMIMLTVLTICLDAVGGLAVATTLPAKTLNGNLSYGVIETFENIYVNHFGEQFRWLVFVVALLLALGVFAEISAWIVGPSKALLEAAYDGILPARFEKTNKNGVSSVGYLTAIGLTVVIYLAAYVLFFLGYFVLILRKGDMKREFHIPGGRTVKLVVAAVGLFMTIITMVISFFPSSKLTAADNRVYQIVLIVCFLISMAAPLIIYSNTHRWSSNGKATGDEK